jgi:hypothetical protein
MLAQLTSQHPTACTHCLAFGILFFQSKEYHIENREGPRGYKGVIRCCMMHCNENPIYVFPEKELRGLSLNFHIHVSVRDLYIPRIGPHIFLQQNS